MSSTRGLRAFHKARMRKRQMADAGALLAQGLAHHQAGHIGRARALYQQILDADPEHFDALHFLGVAEYQNRKLDDADALFRRALAINPRSAEAHSNYSLVFYARGDFESAVAQCDRALALLPGFADALCNRGNALRSLERYREALDDADRAIALKPGFAQAQDVRGSALFKLRRYGEALAAYDRALASRPDYAEVYFNRATLYAEIGKHAEAIADFERALALNPNAIDARVGYAKEMLAAKHTVEAAAACEQALRIDPRSHEAMTMLGQCHEARADVVKAIECYDRALAIKPDFGAAIHNRIFALDFIDSAGFAEQQAARAQWWRHVGAPIYAGARKDHDNDRDPDRRLVVGYVSPDFRRHSAAFGFRPLLANHDRGRIEVVCYSCVARPDDVTADFERIAGRWHNAVHWSDRELEAQVRADRVDILVDMAGHTQGHRLGVFAAKPAPVQVTYGVGDGLPTIDYLFSTEVSVPREVRHLFAETIYDLPCVMTMEPPFDTPEPSDPPMLRNGYVTYGMFNRIGKMSDRAMDVWAAILRADPRARFVVKHLALGDAVVREELGGRFAARGIAGNRVDLLGPTPRPEHLKALEAVDICLDPFPQNGGISTWESLHMGVPVVASLGHSVASRLSGAINAAIDLSDWTAAGDDEYAAIALKFGAMPEHLKALRHGMAERIANSVAGNNARFAGAVDDAYRAVWKKYCAGPA